MGSPQSHDASCQYCAVADSKHNRWELSDGWAKSDWSRKATLQENCRTVRYIFVHYIIHIYAHFVFFDLMCTIHLLMPLWTHRQWCSWNHQVFQLFQHHAPSSRWPSRGWTGPSLCPDGLATMPPWLSPFEPQPSWGPHFVFFNLTIS